MQHELHEISRKTRKLSGSCHSCFFVSFVFLRFTVAHQWGNILCRDAMPCVSLFDQKITDRDAKHCVSTNGF
ncbi:MAG: hypothetical protein LBB88_11180 [Planctomycetaceae bacterium]|nr:hypothetical protein [Planctomycetaceae bacterium]